MAVILKLERHLKFQREEEINWTGDLFGCQLGNLRNFNLIIRRRKLHEEDLRPQKCTVTEYYCEADKCSNYLFFGGCRSVY